jgi:hypothetical protein
MWVSSLLNHTRNRYNLLLFLCTFGKRGQDKNFVVAGFT